MIFTNPQSTSYENRVKERGVLDRFFNADRLDKAKLLASFHLAYIADHVPGRRILDFGCGEGAFVWQAHQEGWDAAGVDLNEGLIAAANEFWGSTRLFSKSLDELVAEGHTFDAIYTNQVFEHLPRPVELGQTLTKLLSPRGIIYIEVPNAARFREWLHRGETLDPTSHFNHFTVTTLSKLVERIGCTPVYATGAPGFFKVWRRLHLGTTAIPLAKLCRRILPGVGGGACAMGRKPA